MHNADRFVYMQRNQKESEKRVKRSNRHRLRNISQKGARLCRLLPQ